MPALPNFIGGSTDRGYVMRFKQGRALVCRHAPAVKHLFQNRFDICRHVYSLLLLVLIRQIRTWLVFYRAGRDFRFSLSFGAKA